MTGKGADPAARLICAVVRQARKDARGSGDEAEDARRFLLDDNWVLLLGAFLPMQPSHIQAMRDWVLAEPFQLDFTL